MKGHIMFSNIVSQIEKLCRIGALLPIDQGKWPFFTGLIGGW